MVVSLGIPLVVVCKYSLETFQIKGLKSGHWIGPLAVKY